MSNSILTSIKKNLYLTDDYTAFDQDIILYINGVFSTLKQLGVGPENGFRIDDKVATWDDFLGADHLMYNDVKTYVTLRVRMLFDPPAVGHHVTAMNEQIKEHEWRINVTRENVEWTDPNGEAPDPENTPILDGGSA